MLLRLMWATWRVRFEPAHFDVPLAEGRRVMLAFWHGQYVPIFAALGGRQGCVFTSRSRRGAIIAEICRRFGYDAVMIADHREDGTFEAMCTALESHRACGIAADGPLGPPHVVKRAVVRLASRCGFAIVASSVASRPKRVFADRWDRMEIPLPFATVCLALTAPLTVPRELPDNGIDEWCGRVAHALELAEREARLALERP